MATHSATLKLYFLFLNFQLKDHRVTIAYTNIALTGKGFFSLTRSNFLTFIGTIITYEVILSQSNYEGSSVRQCYYYLIN